MLWRLKINEEGNAIIFNEYYEALEKKLDDGRTSKMQDLENSEKMECNDIGKNDDRNKYDKSGNVY